MELIIKNKQKIIFRQLFKVPYFCPYIWDYYYCFQKYLIQLFNLSDPAIIQDAQNYLWITCGFIVFSFVNQIFTGILTAAGHSKSTFIATTTGLVLNLILDPVLIFVFNLRVIGAALATIVAQIIVTLVFFI